MTRLLVLDDTDNQRTAILAAALRAGFQEDSIVLCETLEQGRKRLGEPFEMAVVDLSYGDEPHLREAGVQFVKELHERQPECKIIALSLHLANAPGIRALANGAVDYVSGRWSSVSWYVLLREKLGLYKALIEGTDLPAGSSTR